MTIDDPHSVRLIHSYVQHDNRNGGLTDHSLLCFVGMLETGEATEEEFRAVGGVSLWNKVLIFKERTNAG